MSSVVIKSVDITAVRCAIDAYAQRLLEARPDVDEIIVFGSFTKGTYSPGSDVDLLVILGHSEKPFKERIPDLLPGAFPVGLDLMPYTRAEIEARQDSPFFSDILASHWRYRRT